jgi:hypothetical protein
MATTGTGYLTANSVLTDISFTLVEPVVNAQFSAPVTVGQVVAVPTSMTGIYQGAMLVVGAGASLEIVTVAFVSGLTFGATFTKAHATSEPIVGATFPTCQTQDEFFTQSEALTYLAEAQNDYLSRVKCVFNTVTQSFKGTQTIQPYPLDCIQLQRVAVNNVALREQPQSSLDLIQPNWAQSGFGNPKIWYEDRTGYLNYGVWPSPGNAFNAEVLYAQRDTVPLGLNDGFLLPDPFVTSYIKYGCLAKMFAKDGQQADPSRTKFFTQRFESGIEVGAKFLAMTQGPTQDIENG